MGPPTALLERDEELETIEAMLGAARAGTGGVVLVEGEAGAGKTSLLDAAATTAAELGMLVLRARGGAHERNFPYGVMRQLLERQLSDPTRRARALSGAAALAEPVFDPVLSSAADPFSTQHGLHWLISDLAAGSPLALLVDDVQWADESSLRALVYVARRLGDTAAALMLGVRTGEPGTRVDLTEELRRVDGALAIAPAPLSAAAAGALIAAGLEQAPSASFVAACHRASAGNPFLAVELMRGLRAEGVVPTDENAGEAAGFAAAGVTSSIQARLARLGETEVAVARAVAVLEPNATPERLATLAGLDRAVAAEASARLIEAGLLSDGREVGFVHPLVRNAVYSDTREPRRALLHAQAAKLLGAAGAEPDSIAAHLLLAPPGEDPEAVASLRDAAAAAIARGAPEAAVRYLRRALLEAPGPADREEIGLAIGAALLQRDDPAGIEQLKSVRAASRDPALRAEIAAKLAESLTIRDRAAEATAMLDESSAEVGEDDDRLSLLIWTERVQLGYAGGSVTDRAGLLATLDRADATTREGRRFLACTGYLVALGFAPGTLAVEIVERAVADPAATLADAADGYPAWANLATLALVGQTARVLTGFEEVKTVTSGRGTAVGRGIGHVLTALIGFLRGDLLEAQADAQLALDLFTIAGATLSKRLACAELIGVMVARNELAAAEEILALPGMEPDAGAGIPRAFLLCARGELRLAQGAAAEARAYFLAAAREVEWLPHANPELLGWRTGLASAEAALGNREEAARQATEAVALARESGLDRGLGITLRTQGVVLGGEPGLEALREAVALLARTDARLEHGRALVELGAALRRANRRREAREPLREGLDSAHRCGAKALEARARTELEATGARPRSAVLSGVDSLTPSELRIARMAAEGMTNREIAQSLFVTAKTVETHLRHVYPKLEVAKRTELAAVLDRADGDRDAVGDAQP
jgi:DNA-binding NarL/FixJ family response regulator